MTLPTITRKIQAIVGVEEDGIYGPVTAMAVLDWIRFSTSSAEKSAELFEFDERTERNLMTLNPKARLVFRRFMAQAQAVAASMGYEYKAIQGTRTYEEQNELYAKGRSKPGKIVTKAKAGHSWHNFGLAIDCGVFDSRGRYLDSDEPKTAHRVHAAIGQIAPSHGIVWGGSWKSFKDTPHFHLKTGKTLSQCRKLIADGKEVL